MSAKGDNNSAQLRMIFLFCVAFVNFSQNSIKQNFNHNKYIVLLIYPYPHKLWIYLKIQGHSRIWEIRKSDAKSKNTSEIQDLFIFTPASFLFWRYCPELGVYSNVKLEANWWLDEQWTGKLSLEDNDYRLFHIFTLEIT